MKKFKILKKVIGLFLLLSLTAVLIVRCEKDQGNVPIVTTHTYTASAGVGGTIKPLSGKDVLGATVPFTVTENVGYEVDSFMVNGITTKLTDLNYNLKVKGYNLKIEDSDYTIKVIFKRTGQGVLMQHTWGDATLYKRDVGTTEWIPTDTHAYVYTFDDKNCKKFLDGVLIGDSQYMFKGDSLIWGTNSLGNDGIRTKINVLNDETWDYTSLSKYYPGPGDPALPDTELRYVYTAIK